MKRESKENLKKLGISIVYLFGSKAIGKGTPSSDIDIGVVFKNPSIAEDTRALYTILYELFSDLYPVSKLDIVFLQKTPLSLQYSAIKDGKVLFEEDPVLRADYEYRVINQYLDFRPVLDFFDRIATERYGKT
jgi:uncharacterized protein